MQPAQDASQTSPACPRAYACPRTQAHLQGLPQRRMQLRRQGVLRSPPSSVPRLLRRRLQEKEVRIFSRADSRRLRRAQEVSSRQQVAGGRTQRGRAQAEQRLFPLALIGPLTLFDAFAPCDACWWQEERKFCRRCSSSLGSCAALLAADPARHGLRQRHQPAHAALTGFGGPARRHVLFPCCSSCVRRPHPPGRPRSSHWPRSFQAWFLPPSCSTVVLGFRSPCSDFTP